MSIYNVGTVDVTNGSATVTGDGTQTFLTSIVVNQLFKVTGYSTVYMVASLISDDSFTISPVWADITLTGASYNVIRDYTPNRDYPLISQGTSDWPIVLSRALASIDEDMGISGISTLANEATPSVSGFNKCLTGGTTTITDFDDGYTGQIIIIISEHTVTITDGTNIFLNGSANFVMAATDTLTLICKADGKWYEIGRSDNT